MASSLLTRLRPTTMMPLARRLATPPGTTPTLRTRLQEDLKSAMRNRADQTRLSAIRSMVSAVTYADKAAGAPVNDDAVVKELRKLIRKHQESIDQFTTAGHKDEANVEKQQMDIVSQYIPETMSIEEIEQAVQAAIGRTQAKSTKDVGKVMQDLNVTLTDTTRAPRKLVSDVAKRLLSVTSGQ